MSTQTAISDIEKAAIRSYLQRAEVRLSTMQRIAGVFLNGAGLLALFPVLFKDALISVLNGISRLNFSDVGNFVTVIDTIFRWQLPLYKLALLGCVFVTLFLPLIALGFLLRDIVAFYFTAHNPHRTSATQDADEEFYPRLALTGIPCSDDDLTTTTRTAIMEQQEHSRYKWFLLPYSKISRESEYDNLPNEVMSPSRKNRFDSSDDSDVKRPDRKRLAIAFGLAGVDDRNLLEEAAKSELSLVRHSLLLRRLVLRYIKALIAFILTSIVTFTITALIGNSTQTDDKLTPQTLILVAFFYLIWGGITPLLVRLPIWWIWGRYVPSTQKGDAARDPHLINFEWFVFGSGFLTIGLSTWFIITESLRHSYNAAIWISLVMAILFSSILLLLFYKQLKGKSR